MRKPPKHPARFHFSRFAFCTSLMFGLGACSGSDDTQTEIGDEPSRTKDAPSLSSDDLTKQKTDPAGPVHHNELPLLAQADLGDQRIVKFYQLEDDGILISEIGPIDRWQPLPGKDTMSADALYESLTGTDAPKALKQAAKSLQAKRNKSKGDVGVGQASQALAPIDTYPGGLNGFLWNYCRDDGSDRVLWTNSVGNGSYQRNQQWYGDSYVSVNSGTLTHHFKYRKHCLGGWSSDHSVDVPAGWYHGAGYQASGLCRYDYHFWTDTTDAWYDWCMYFE